MTRARPRRPGPRRPHHRRRPDRRAGQGRRRRRAGQDPPRPRPRPHRPGPGRQPASDLERMQHEMESLERRITTLEDEELEVMARLEDAQRNLDDLTAQLADADARNARLEKARDGRYAEIDAELAELAGQRAPIVEGCRPTCWLSTTGCAPQERRGRCRAARPPVRRLHARPRQRRARPDPRRGRRRGAALRGVPADPGAHRRVGL